MSSLVAEAYPFMDLEDSSADSIDLLERSLEEDRPMLGRGWTVRGPGGLRARFGRPARAVPGRAPAPRRTRPVSRPTCPRSWRTPGSTRWTFWERSLG